ncbi:Succinate dehydrogenase cytochrome b-556 subunit [hydrothermal vent metagenome]|uniref:Succinate dehydrogenase cytochrome b-556 subunit n=1 Tax=hydrothermal vent metagenome TaxID=652676 RepID=A0A3B0R7Z9_9ZZZZ
MSTKPERPLSPHLQIYKPMLTMTVSIIHRITGIALFFATLLLAWWLIAAAAGPAYFDFVEGLLTSAIGRLILLGCTWALIHHALGGLKHLLWDTGRGYGLETIEKLAKGSLVLSIALTLVVWAIAYAVR